jgi:hypothetical protein
VEIAVAKELTHRRRFLVHSASTALAMKHVASEGKMPRLLLVLCAFSFGPFFKTGEMTYESFIQTAIGLKADGVDMTLY